MPSLSRHRQASEATYYFSFYAFISLRHFAISCHLPLMPPILPGFRHAIIFITLLPFLRRLRQLMPLRYADAMLRRHYADIAAAMTRHDYADIIDYAAFHYAAARAMPDVDAAIDAAAAFHCLRHYYYATIHPGV
jgi:hypothetical protein